MLDDMFDHLESLRSQPAWRPIPDEIRARRRTPLPTEPQPLAQVHDAFLREVLPYASGNLHPGFMGWVQGGGTPVGMLADMLAAGLNANCGGRDHMPIAVEQEVAGWANFIGVLAARQRALGPAVRAQGVTSGGADKLVAYTSTATHSCVPRAMELAGLGRDALRLIRVDAQHRIDLDALRERLAVDRAAGKKPFLIIASAGTVDAGAIDDLSALADIAAAEGAWLHVDGAYGALGVLTPVVAPRLAGIERADSIAFDFHKWGQVPYDAGYILMRDGALQREVFAVSAQYLSREPRGLAAGDWWPSDYGPDLSRGFRALKVWFTLKVLGADAIGASIARSCELGLALGQMVEATPELELLAPVQLNIVCFRYRCDDPDRINAAIVADLQEAGRVAPSLTRIDGQVAIRAALFNHRTDRGDIEALVESCVAFGDAAVRSGAA